MQPGATDPDLVPVEGQWPPPIYDSTWTMIGWYLFLVNFAGVVPVIVASAYVTYGFFVKRDLGSAVAVNGLCGVLLWVMKQHEIPSSLARDSSAILVTVLALFFLMSSCATDVLRIRNGQVAHWIRAVVLLALASGLFAN